MSVVEGSRAPDIAVLGGGTGSSTLLRELKSFTPHLSAIVNMSDDGHSSGALKEELGVLPPGDVRQCLIALSNLPEVRDLFGYRFDSEGGLSGHSLGNLILAGAERFHGDFDKARKLASKLLQITGQVIPVTLEPHTLVMQDGADTIRGEFKIGHRPITQPDATISYDPPVSINPDADKAIRQADLVVIAPGNLYGSLLPTLAVDGLAAAFNEANAKKIMVSNLVTKPGQTDGWHVVDYVKAVERYIGEDQIDVVLYNQDLPSEELLSKYAEKGEFPVKTDPDRFAEIAARALGANLVAGNVAEQNSGYPAQRTIIRHDANEVGRQLMRLFH